MVAKRLSSGGLIDRNRRLNFTWDGRNLSGYAGDTLASALLASNQMVLGRSFKYHRPRGIMSAGVEESGAAGGDITIVTEDGDLTVVAAGGGVDTSAGAGNITLTAGDSGAGNDGDLDVNDGVVSNSGNINLTSAGADIVFSDAGDVTSTSGNVSIQATNGCKGRKNANCWVPFRLSGQCIDNCISPLMYKIMLCAYIQWYDQASRSEVHRC